MRPNMNRILAKSALALLAATLSVTASAEPALTGQWKNPKGSVVVRLGPCGSAMCGVVVDASEHAKESARKGGTPNLVGTRILSGLRPNGDGSYRGQAFDPKRNIHAPATVRILGPDALLVEGCAFLGLVCKEQRWTRVS
jgi:uncharacterized protein (DUF2147 family)